MAITPGIMWSGHLTPPVWYGEELDPAGFMDLLAQMGLQSIDIFARHVDAHGTETLRNALHESGLSCSCFYIQGDLLAAGEDLREVDEDFERGLSAAAELGARLAFTHGSQHARTGDEALAAYIDVLAERNRQAQEHCLTLVIENAGHLVRTPEDMLAVMDALGDEGLRLCPDVGNFSIWGIDEGDALRRLLPWTVHVHLKDLNPDYVGNEDARGVPAVLGQGVTPIDEVIALLQAQVWDGAAVWEAGPHDENEMTEGIEELLRLIGQAREEAD